MLTEESVSYHDFMDDPWCPSERSWTKDSVGDVFEVLSISESCRNVTWSHQIFETTVKHVKSLFPLDMDCLQVTQIFGVEEYRLKIPEDLDDIKPLLSSLASRYVASWYEQAPEHVFQPFTFGNKNVFICPQYT